MFSFTLNSGGLFLHGGAGDMQSGDTLFSGTAHADIFVAFGMGGMTFAPGVGADLIYGFKSGVDHLLLDGGPRTTMVVDTRDGVVVYHDHLGPGPDKVLLAGVHHITPGDLLFA